MGNFDLIYSLGIRYLATQAIIGLLLGGAACADEQTSTRRKIYIDSNVATHSDPDILANLSGANKASRNSTSTNTTVLLPKESNAQTVTKTIQQPPQPQSKDNGGLPNIVPPTAPTVSPVLPDPVPTLQPPQPIPMDQEHKNDVPLPPIPNAKAETKQVDKDDLKELRIEDLGTSNNTTAVDGKTQNNSNAQVAAPKTNEVVKSDVSPPRVAVILPKTTPTSNENQSTQVASTPRNTQTPATSSPKRVEKSVTPVTQNRSIKSIDQEEEIIIEEVLLEEVNTRPIYDHKTVVLPDAISKKEYSEENKHLPKVFYQSEYTDLLFDAVKNNDVPGIKSLLDKGANINAQDKVKGHTLLMHAIKFNSLKALRSLIVNKADIQKTNLQGQTALHVAASHNNAQAMEILLTAGINPTVKDNKGNRASEYMRPSMRNTAIIMASNYRDKSKALVDFVGLGAYDAVKYALDNGANINVLDDVNKDGDTPLIIAIRCQDIKMISLLLNKGARLDVRNKKGKLPSQVATDVNNREIQEILKTVQVKRELERAAL